MANPRFVIVAFALLAAACGANAAGPPDIVVDRTTCHHCGMFVSEPAIAAAYQAEGQEPRVFDEIGCMVEALRRETASPITVWVQDAAGDGWLNADEALFVAASRIRTPMGGGVLAFADATAANKAAAAHDGRVLQSLHEVMTSIGGSR